MSRKHSQGGGAVAEHARELGLLPHVSLEDVASRPSSAQPTGRRACEDADGATVAPLSEEERASISAYLATLRGASGSRPPSAPPPPDPPPDPPQRPARATSAQPGTRVQLPARRPSRPSSASPYSVAAAASPPASGGGPGLVRLRKFARGAPAAGHRTSVPTLAPASRAAPHAATTPSSPEAAARPRSGSRPMARARMTRRPVLTLQRNGVYQRRNTAPADLQAGGAPEADAATTTAGPSPSTAGSSPSSTLAAATAAFEAARAVQEQHHREQQQQHQERPPTPPEKDAPSPPQPHHSRHRHHDDGAGRHANGRAATPDKSSPPPTPLRPPPRPPRDAAEAERQPWGPTDGEPAPRPPGEQGGGGPTPLEARVQELREAGNTRFHQHDYAGAARLYTEALELSPLDTVVLTNRAAAHLQQCRYALAAADCRCVLLLDPVHYKASWRAGKALLGCDRPEAARSYYGRARASCEAGGTELAGSPPGARARSGSGSGQSGAVKRLRDGKAIAAEERALPHAERYAECMRLHEWGRAREEAGRVLQTFGRDGAAAAPWLARELEAQLHMSPQAAAGDIRRLAAAHPGSLDLYRLHAKCIFYCAHDGRSTDRALAVLDDGAAEAERQAAALAGQVRAFAAGLRARGAAGDAGLARQVEGWAESMRPSLTPAAASLRSAVERFACSRDEGNAAYGRGDWAGAHAAYTRCLRCDPLNVSLMTTCHCNRAAVSMQAGRLADALEDTSAALRLSPGNAKALARRGRVHLHLAQQEAAAAARGSPAGAERCRHHLDAAVADMTEAAELAPSAESRAQLRDAIERRRAFLATAAGGGGGGSASSRAPPEDAPPSPPRGHQQHNEQQQHARNPRPRHAPRYFTFDDSTASYFGSEGRRWYQQQQQQQQSRAPSPAASQRQRHLTALGLGAADVGPGGVVEAAALKRAYREAALRWHPDKWVAGTEAERASAETRFKEIAVAYQALREGGDE